MHIWCTGVAYPRPLFFHTQQNRCPYSRINLRRQSQQHLKCHFAEVLFPQKGLFTPAKQNPENMFLFDWRNKIRIWATDVNVAVALIFSTFLRVPNSEGRLEQLVSWQKWRVSVIPTSPSQMSKPKVWQTRSWSQSTTIWLYLSGCASHENAPHGKSAPPRAYASPVWRHSFTNRTTQWSSSTRLTSTRIKFLNIRSHLIPFQ